MGKKEKNRSQAADAVLKGTNPYLSIAEAALGFFNCSPITLRRRIARGEAKGLVLMDPFGRGKPLIARKSLEEFFLAREKATAKEFKPAAHLYVQ
jgi:hypothetical protein